MWEARREGRWRGLRLSMDSKHSSSSSTLSGSMSWSCPPSSACLDGAIAANPRACSAIGNRGERLGASAASATRTIGGEKGEERRRTCGRRWRRPGSGVGGPGGEGSGGERGERLRESGCLVKVNLTGGNRSGLTGYRSNRSGPVPVSAGTQPAKIQILNLNLNSKNEKFSKISKNTSRCDGSNGIKFSQKFVHLV